MRSPRKWCWRRFRQDRSWRVAVVFVVALCLVIADIVTWSRLDIAAIFGFPLVLVAQMRSPRLLWFLVVLLTIATFAVYAYQIRPGAFLLGETFFVNRVLDVADLREGRTAPRRFAEARGGDDRQHP